jgi:hypothetical protein
MKTPHGSVSFALFFMCLVGCAAEAPNVVVPESLPVARHPTAPAAATTASIAGAWRGTWASGQSGNGTTRATFTQSGDAIDGAMHLTGSPCFERGRVVGTFGGQELTATFASSDAKVALTASLDGDVLRGTYSVISGECRGDTGTFTASR